MSTVIIVEPELENERLDAALPVLFPEKSRNAFQKLIKDGKVFLNQSVILKPGMRLTEGDRIEIDFPEPVALSIEPDGERASLSLQRSFGYQWRIEAGHRASDR